MRKRSSIWIAAAFALIVLAVYFRLGSPRNYLDPPLVVREIRGMNELTTVKYVMQKVVGIKEDKSPVGQEFLLLMVQGEVLAGIELGRVQSGDIRMAGRTMEIRLPRPAVLNVFLDEGQTKVWDRHVTWWTPWVGFNPDLETRARRQALADMRESAIQSGILKEARARAETALASLFRAAGMEKVTFGGGNPD